MNSSFLPETGDPRLGDFCCCCFCCSNRAFCRAWWACNTFWGRTKTFLPSFMIKWPCLMTLWGKLAVIVGWAANFEATGAGEVVDDGVGDEVGSCWVFTFSNKSYYNNYSKRLLFPRQLQMKQRKSKIHFFIFIVSKWFFPNKLEKHAKINPTQK